MYSAKLCGAVHLQKHFDKPSFYVLLLLGVKCNPWTKLNKEDFDEKAQMQIFTTGFSPYG